MSSHIKSVYSAFVVPSYGAGVGSGKRHAAPAAPRDAPPPDAGAGPGLPVRPAQRRKQSLKKMGVSPKLSAEQLSVSVSCEES